MALNEAGKSGVKHIILWPHQAHTVRIQGSCASRFRSVHAATLCSDHELHLRTSPSSWPPRHMAHPAHNSHRTPPNSSRHRQTSRIQPGPRPTHSSQWLIEHVPAQEQTVAATAHALNPSPKAGTRYLGGCGGGGAPPPHFPCFCVIFLYFLYI